MKDNTPEWAKFVEVSFDGKTGKPKKEYKEFWDKVRELRAKGTKCKCGNDEVEGYNHCVRCFLKTDKEDYWVWTEPRRKGGRWLCCKSSFYWKMIKAFPIENGIGGGAFIMATNRGDKWELMRWYFWKTQGGKCANCKNNFEEGEMELHHIEAKVNGGRETEDNLQMLCKLCHRTKMIEIYN